MSPVWRATIAAGIGKIDEALTWLEQGYEERTHWLTWLGNPAYNWEPLPSEPRFQELIRRVDFPRLSSSAAGGADETPHE